jgi:hypothetical protein
MSESTEQKEKEQVERYFRAAHAVQSGLAYLEQKSPKMFTPKHLRVGVDSTKAEAGGLAALLIEKGVFTRLEYLTATADAMEKEVAMLEAETAMKFISGVWPCPRSLYSS